MKIALVSEYYYPVLGGITEHIHYLAQTLGNRGHDVTVITHNIKPRSDHHYPDEPLTYKVVRFGRGLSIYSNGSFARLTLGKKLGATLRNFFEEQNFDVIHAHSPLTPTLPFLALRKSNATATIGTFHTYFDRSRSYSLFSKKIARHMDMMDAKIVVSPVCIDALSRYFDTEYTFIPNGVDTNFFSPEAPRVDRFNDDKLNILFVGRFDPRNGLRTMIEAFKLVRKEFSNCRLIVVGDGPLKNYYNSLIDSSIAEDVHFEGLINGGRPNYYATADIYCSPCTKAACGVVILEAMASGTPIVASNIEGYRIVMERDRLGITVPEYTPKSFAENLLLLLRDPEMRREMGEAGRQLALNHYSWESITEQIENLYGDIAGIPDKPEINLMTVESLA